MRNSSQKDGGGICGAQQQQQLIAGEGLASKEDIKQMHMAATGRQRVTPYRAVRDSALPVWQPKRSPSKATQSAGEENAVVQQYLQNNSCGGSRQYVAPCSHPLLAEGASHPSVVAELSPVAAAVMLARFNPDATVHLLTAQRSQAYMDVLNPERGGLPRPPEVEIMARPYQHHHEITSSQPVGANEKTKNGMGRKGHDQHGSSASVENESNKNSNKNDSRSRNQPSNSNRSNTDAYIELMEAEGEVGSGTGKGWPIMIDINTALAKCRHTKKRKANTTK